MNDKRGISVVVASVLIVFLVIVAALILTVAIIPMVREGTSSYATENVDLQIASDQGYTFYDSKKKILEFQVARGADDEGEVEFRFIVTFEDGNSETSAPFVAPEANSKKVYPFGMEDEVAAHGNPVSVKISSPSKRVVLTGEVVSSGSYGLVKISSGTSKRNYADVFDFGSLVISVGSCQKLDEDGATYSLTNDLWGENVTDECFEITGNDVTLDCNEHYIYGNSNDNIVYANGVVNPMVRGCRIEFNGGKIGAYFKNVDGGEITDLNVNNSQGVGILVYKSNGVSVSDNVVSASESDGIMIKNSLGNVLVGNVADDNGAKGIQLYRSDNNTVDRNELRRNQNNGCLQLREADGNLIRNNLMDDCQTYGVWVWDSAYNTFENNRIQNIQSGYSSFARGVFIRNSKANNNNFYCDQFENNQVDVVDWGKNNFYHGISGPSGWTGGMVQTNCTDFCNWDVRDCLVEPKNDSNFSEGPEFKFSFDDVDLYANWNSADADLEDAPVLVVKSLIGNSLSVAGGREMTSEAYLRWAPSQKPINRSVLGDVNYTMGALEVFYKDVAGDYTPTNKARFEVAFSREDIANGINVLKLYSSTGEVYYVEAYINQSNIYLRIHSSLDESDNVRLMVGGTPLTYNTGSLEWFGRNDPAIDKEQAMPYDILSNFEPVGTYGGFTTKGGLELFYINVKLDHDEVFLGFNGSLTNDTIITGGCGDGVCSGSSYKYINGSAGWINYNGQEYPLNISYSDLNWTVGISVGFSDYVNFTAGQSGEVNGVPIKLHLINYNSSSPYDKMNGVYLSYGEDNDTCSLDCSLDCSSGVCVNNSDGRVTKTEIMCNGNYTYIAVSSYQSCSNGMCSSSVGSGPLTYCPNGCEPGIGCVGGKQKLLHWRPVNVTHNDKTYRLRISMWDRDVILFEVDDEMAGQGSHIPYTGLKRGDTHSFDNGNFTVRIDGVYYAGLTNSNYDHDDYYLYKYVNISYW